MPTVLLVEDDRDLRHTMAEVLEAEGYECIAVEAGAQAIEYLEAHRPPCMMLLDLGLPGIDGLTLIRRFAQDESLRKVPIAIISAEAERRAREIAEFQDHVVHVMKKPFEIDTVLDVLERHCRRSGAQRAPRAPGR